MLVFGTGNFAMSWYHSTKHIALRTWLFSAVCLAYFNPMLFCRDKGHGGGLVHGKVQSSRVSVITPADAQ
jgi:hypothetical protein